MNHKIIVTGLFFGFVFVFGFWLSRSGKPYNAILFNFHKLIGLAMGIFLIMTVFQAHRMAAFTPLEIVVIAVTVVIFLSLVAAGGLLSVEAAGGLGSISSSMSAVISVGHKVLPYLAVLSTATTLYLLLFRKG
jgi:hypothetical protein